MSELRTQVERHLIEHPQIVAAQVLTQVRRGLPKGNRVRRDDQGRLVLTDQEFEALLTRLLTDGITLALHGFVQSFDDSPA